jgi:hypothetical protein
MEKPFRTESNSNKKREIYIIRTQVYFQLHQKCENDQII